MRWLLSIYFGVDNSADRKHRTLFKALVENEIGNLESQLGEKLHWFDPYFSAITSAKIGDKVDWPRQHQWVRDTAEKFVAVFKSRLGIE
jgi:hypothetical protein